ncbi:MAG: glycosyltransferase [Desulfarculus sp.]|nr:glycosyltransferase [Pseudomonadota bacterium]MBV1717642.1 glycosyltransferase [Desulfarculus sp.]MBU4575439.1 glycosyltransferase [Pseudomonadota bacterium]MBU4599183.1 glycosyltransferase [Pseudomonadota bacterium]MBV1739764.1 glycosyltransferase [Desulfarculus sp.]
MSPKLLTVIIPSLGMLPMLEQCLDALGRSLEAAGVREQSTVAVVDNASHPPLPPKRIAAAGAELLRLDGHHCFARANNLAARRWPAKHYLMQNNDVLVQPETIGEMLGLLGRMPQVGICGARMVFPDGSLQHAGVVFGPGKKGPYHLLRTKPSHLMPRIDREFQAVTGGCMLIRGELWQELGGLDEDYPFGLEDIDFCLRARQSGQRIFCCQGSESLHFEAMTPGRAKLDSPSRALFMSRWQGRYTIDG